MDTPYEFHLLFFRSSFDRLSPGTRHLLLYCWFCFYREVLRADLRELELPQAAKALEPVRGVDSRTSPPEYCRNIAHTQRTFTHRLLLPLAPSRPGYLLRRVNVPYFFPYTRTPPARTTTSISDKCNISSRTSSSTLASGPRVIISSRTTM
jgi:hypothetical protein